MDQSDLVDVLIVGGGPAGLSAALILGRCRRRVVLCDDGAPRNASSHAMHGFLSRDGINPQKLRAVSFDQLRQYGVEIRALQVCGAACRDDMFDAALEDGETIRARTVLLATGVVDRVPELQGVQELYGRSVFHCPYCDGWEVRDQPLAAYGRHGKGVKLATGLLSWSEDVVLFTDGERLRRSEAEHLKALRIPVYQERIRSLEGTDGLLERIVLASGTAIDRRAMFFKTGAIQRSDLAASLGCDFNEKGMVKVNRLERAHIPGLYVAGDASEDVQLAIVAAAEGAKAAFAIDGYLREQGLRARIRAVASAA